MTRIGAKLFVQVWNAAQSLKEVASVTGLSKEAASRRAARYRKQVPEVPLKRFKTGRKSLAEELRD